MSQKSTSAPKMNQPQLLVVLITTLMACGPGLKQAQNVPGTPASSPELGSHCELLEPLFKQANLVCLNLPGSIISGVYGPHDAPNQNNLEGGFGGKVPPIVVGADRDAGTMERTFSQTRSVDAHLGLDLSSFYKWLPRTDWKLSINDSVNVRIVLGSMKLRPIQNLTTAIEQALYNSKDEAQKLAINRMKKDLCKPNWVLGTLALVARPTIIIETKTKKGIGSTIGWSVLGFNVNADHATEGKLTLTADQDIVFAAQPRPSAGILDDLCNEAKMSCIFTPNAHADCYRNATSSPWAQSIKQNPSGEGEANCGVGGGIGHVMWDGHCETVEKPAESHAVGSISSSFFGHCGDGVTLGGGRTGGSGRVSPSWEFPINIVGSTSYSLTVTTPDAPLFANGKCRIVVMSVNPPQIVRSMDQNAFRIGPLNEGIHRIQISCAAFGVGCLGGRSGQRETGSQNFQFTALLSRSGLTKDS